MAMPSLTVHIAANIAELKKALAEGTSVITTTTAAMDKLAKSFSGDKIVQHAHNVVAAVNQVGASALTTAEASRQIDVLERAMDKMARTSKPIPEDMKRIAEELKKTHPEIEQSSKKTDSLVGSLVKLAPAMIAAFAVQKIKQFATDVLDAADSLAKMSAKTGISVEGLQYLQAAAIAGGNEIEQVASAVNKMQANLAGEDKGAVKAIKALGLSLSDQFMTLGTAIQKIEDPADRVKLRVLLFGKAGNEIAGTLAQDFGSIKNNAVIMANGTVEAFDTAGDALEQLMVNYKNTVANWLVSAHTAITHWSQGLAITLATLKASWMDGIAGWAELSAKLNLAPGMGDKLKAYAQEWRDAANKSKDSLDDIVKGVGDMRAAEEKAIEPTKNIAKSLLDLGDDAKTTKAKLSDAEKALKEWNDGCAKASEKLYWLTSGGSGFDELAPLVKTNATALDAARESMDNLDATAINFGTVTLPKVVKSSGVVTQAIIDQRNEQEKSLATLSDLAASFERLANIAGGSLGEMVRSFGTLISSMDLADKSTDQIKAGWGALQSGGAGLLSGITSIASGFLGWVSAAASAYSAIKSLFGGVSAEVKAARSTLAEFQTTLKNTLSLDQIAEAGSDQWKMDVIAVRDAYLAVGRTAEEAYAIVEQMWNTDDPEASAAAIAEINAVLERQTEILERRAELDAEIAGIETQIATLEASLVPTWADMSSVIEQYGLNINALGNAVQQVKLDEYSTDLLNAWETMQAGGADMQGVLVGMSDEFSRLVQDSIRYGTTIPENMRPMIESLAEQGLLLDANGDRMTDIGGLTWGKEVQSEADIISDAIEELTKQLKLFLDELMGVTPAAENVADGLYSSFAEEPWADWEAPNFPVYEPPEWGADYGPDYASRGGLVTDSGIVQYMARGGVVSRGSDTVPAMLTPGERVLSVDQNRAYESGSPIVINLTTTLDGRVVARNQIQHQPRELARLGLN
jgi:hypothetical protein